MTANTPFLLPTKSADGVIEYLKECNTLLNLQWNFRENLRNIDLVYIREQDFTVENQRARLANKLGDANRYQNIQVPVVMPAVEEAVKYQASVFLTGQPLFGVVSSPEFIDAAKMMESVIDQNAIYGGWVRQLMMFFRDGFKYNFSAIECAWDQRNTAVLETDIKFSKTEGKPKNVVWEGNCLKRWDPYNIIFDTRVPLTEIPEKGEFAGHTEIMGRTQLKKFFTELPSTTRVKEAFESGVGNINIAGGSAGPESFYIPQINPEAFMQNSVIYSTNWLQWAGASGGEQRIEYKNIYCVTTLYARIIPSDFNLAVPDRNTPQIWKFIIINFQVVVYSERQTNAHDKIPVFFGSPQEDGLGVQTKSLAQNVQPFQAVNTALMNSIIAARRRAISDRGLYDPSRVTRENINSDNPSAKIPVRPAAYGKPLGESYYPIPFRDENSATAMQQMAAVNALANVTTGQNPARQGQFVKGNKTLHEYESVMQNASGRDQMTAMLYESQIFTPLKEVIKFNILQYQGNASYYNREKAAVVQIDPVVLRNAVMEFKVSDGLIPSDKLIASDTLQVAMQVIGSAPAIGAAYNIAPLFSYMMKTQGADIAAFEKPQEQVAYEQAMQQWQQTVQQIADQMIKAGQTPDPKNFPPQPTPDQFGFDPTGKKQQQEAQQKAENPPSIIDTVMGNQAPQAAPQQGQQAPVQGAAA